MIANTIVNKARPAEILLVEDNTGDVLLAKKAFQKSKIANNITVAKNGEIALQILRREGEYAGHVLPDLILLDLNLPKKSGKEVLAEIKSDNHLKHIPVVVLTSSHAELDVIKTYDLHANSYLIKPISLDKFFEVVQSIEQYWFAMVVLPDADVSSEEKA